MIMNLIDFLLLGTLTSYNLYDVKRITSKVKVVEKKQVFAKPMVALMEIKMSLDKHRAKKIIDSMDMGGVCNDKL